MGWETSTTTLAPIAPISLHLSNHYLHWSTFALMIPTDGAAAMNGGVNGESLHPAAAADGRKM